VDNFVDGAEYTTSGWKKFILENGKKADFYYGNQVALELVQGFDKSKLDTNCENIRIKRSPYKINIINNTLQTNFSKGFICIWFQGLRVDEDTNDIILPEDPNARIYEFLMYSGKAKVFELLWGNGDDTDVQTKLQYFNQKMEQARTSASAQARMSSVTGKNWWKGLKEKQKRRTRIFEL